MKVEELIKQHRRRNARKTLSPLQSKVMGFFEQHKGEVFRYGDMQIANSLKERPSAVNWSIWALQKKGFLAKTKAAGRVFVGAPEDVQKLEEGLK